MAGSRAEMMRTGNLSTDVGLNASRFVEKHRKEITGVSRLCRAHLLSVITKFKEKLVHCLILFSIDVLTILIQTQWIN